METEEPLRTQSRGFGEKSSRRMFPMEIRWRRLVWVGAGELYQESLIWQVLVLYQGW
jgi:hypothetical protein